MRVIKEILYVIALFSAAGIFGFFVVVSALNSIEITLEDGTVLDISSRVETTLNSAQFAFFVLGLPLSIIAALLVQLVTRDPRGRVPLLMALFGFAGVTAITLYFNSFTQTPEGSLIAILKLLRIVFAGLSLLAMGYAFRANGREFFR